MKTDTPVTLTLSALASRWACSPDSIYRFMRDDLDLPMPFTLPSGAKRWHLAEIEAYEAAHRHQRAA